MNHTALPAWQIANMVSTGKVSAEAVMHNHLERIRSREPLISAFTIIDENLALERAHALDKSDNKKGILAGVPFAIKDIIDSTDFPVSLGSHIHANRRPAFTAHCVAQCMDAGAIPVGMSVSTEFACFTPGKTCNPHNFKHTPGGSSSGSAAAVADQMVAFGFGSQTAASLVRPAAFCGIYAYKSSHGHLNLDRVMNLAPTLDSLGVLTRSATDLHLLWSVLRGVSKIEINTDTFIPPRVTLMHGPYWDECSDTVKSACIKALEILSNNGGRIVGFRCPKIFRYLTEAHKLVMGYELVRTRKYEYDNHRNQLSPQFKEIYETGLSVCDTDYFAAIEVRDSCIALLDKMFESTDILITPAAHGEAPRGLDTTGDPLFSRMWTLLQTPSTTIPFGIGPSGLPLAIQVIGQRNCDEALLIATRWAAKFLE